MDYQGARRPVGAESVGAVRLAGEQVLSRIPSGRLQFRTRRLETISPGSSIPPAKHRAACGVGVPAKGGYDNRLRLERGPEVVYERRIGVEIRLGSDFGDK